jgi:glycosyltransferase involved in cell wall biosynthesis
VPTIGLSMIVKNGGEGLRSCLKSVRSLVDQIVIADTGSTDDSIAIAREFGATVVDFPWCDDYAAARNAALDPLTTDWVLSLDADEEVLPESLVEIRRLVDRREEVAGYNLTVRCYVHNRSVSFEGSSSRENHDDAERARSAPFYLEFLSVRLFRRHPQIFYTGCVHEMVISQIGTLGMQVKNAKALIRNYGRLWDAETCTRKQAYYRRLGHRRIEEEPGNVDAWYTLGLAEFYYGDNREAIRCMEQAYTLLKIPQPLYYIAKALQREGRLEAALTILAHVGDSGDLGLQKNLLRGEVLHDLNRFEEARCAFRRALEECERDSILGAWQSALESRLGYVEVRLGNHRSGMEMLRRSIAMKPEEIEFHDRLVKACVAAGDERGAADAAEAALEHCVEERLFARAAALRLRLKQPQQAQRLLETGLRFFPESTSLQRMHA